MATLAQEQRSRKEQERRARTVLHFLRTRAKLDMLIAESARAGHIPFADVEQFVEQDLFQLKEACHAIFRASGADEEPDVSSGALFDILVGSIFHQMMMVKENTYQIESYEPKYAAVRRAMKGPNPPENGEAFIREGKRLTDRARRALKQEMTTVVELFGEAATALRRALAENRDNPLLVRTLLDQEEVLDSVYGPRSLEKILSEMYDGRPANGYLVAAADLLEGGWFDRARTICQRALELEPDNDRARRLLNKINAAARAHLE
jgi:hypothetical protein